MKLNFVCNCTFLSTLSMTFNTVTKTNPDYTNLLIELRVARTVCIFLTRNFIICYGTFPIPYFFFSLFFFLLLINDEAVGFLCLFFVFIFGHIVVP